MHPCLKDTDCPSIGHRCYPDNFLKPLSSGSCHCWSALALYGGDCQFSETYAKIFCCVLFSVSSVGFLISLRMILKMRRKIFSFNAMATTLCQNTLGFMSACAGHGLGIYCVFYSKGDDFWKPAAYCFFTTASLIHACGSALNVSLLWLEISTFSEFRIVKNVERTKSILITSILLLYSVLLVLGVALCDYPLVLLIFLLFVIFLMVTFGIGAWCMSKKLFCDQSSSTLAQHNIADVNRILANTKTVLICSVIYLCSQMLYLATFNQQITSISFPTFICFQIYCLCIEFTVLWHLRGKSLLCWEFSNWIPIHAGHTLPRLQIPILKKCQKPKIFPHCNPTLIFTKVGIEEPQTKLGTKAADKL